MKRRFTNSTESDSLELLLDTLCNVFGGIVLIACLLAILPRQDMPPPLLPEEEATAAMLERRMTSAQEEISRIEAEIERLLNSTDPKLAELQARRDSLKRTSDRLQSEIRKTQNQESGEAEALAIISQANPDLLAERLKELKLEKSKIEGIESAATEKIKFLEERIKNLQDEAGKLAGGRTQAVRFPRERRAASSPFPIIIRYGAIYPLNIGKDFGDNTAVTMIPFPSEEGFQADPVKGSGIIHPEGHKQLEATLRAAAKKGYYATLYLYPDSHKVFGELREVLAKESLTYGLEFVDADRKLAFSSEGTAPPEL